MTQDVVENPDAILTNSVPKYISPFSEDDWYKRPITISTVQIATSSSVDLAVGLLTSWLSDPLVNRKIKSVNLIRPMFKVRVQLTSNPTVCGSIACCIAFGGKSLLYTYQNIGYLGGAYISSCGVNACELTVPWSYPHDYYTLNDGGTAVVRTVTETGTSGDVMSQFPSLKMISSANLRTVAASFPGVGLKVTMWCESLETARIYQPQSGNDEYGKPEISKAATALAKQVSKITNPTLVPFATATSLALRVGSGVASALGYSRPMEIEHPEPCVLQKYGNQYNLSGTRVGRRLVEDPKQELALNDPSSCNSYGIDELSFDRLVDAWTVVTEADITPPLTAGVLFYFPVTPTYTQLGVGSGSYLYSPMSLTAMCFRYWRGHMRYKIRIDSTIYHSGVIQVLWSPLIRNGSITNTNQNEQLLIDVSGTKEVEFVVPYSAAAPFLKTRQADSAVSQSVSVVDSHLYNNGDIRINVFAPISGACPIRMTIWAKGEPGFDFNVFSDFSTAARYNNVGAPDTITAIQAQAVNPVAFSSTTVGVSSSGLYVPQSGGGLEASANPSSIETFYLGPKPSDNVTHQNVIGQEFRSLRPYLKRNMPYIRWTTSATYSRIGIDLPSFPMPPSRYNLSGNFTNYVTGNAIGLFSSAFLGWRGGLRYHAVPTADAEATAILTNESSGFTFNCISWPSLTFCSNEPDFATLRSQFVNYNRGVQHFGHEEEISFEIPYRYNQNWVANSRIASLSDNGPLPPQMKNLTFATLYYQLLGGTKVAIDVSAGEDFNYFIRMPLNPVTVWTNSTSNTLITGVVHPTP